jgi:predicted TIM-barrel fold metal-dependent hydrolase
MKIDVSAHITPPKYLKTLGKKLPPEVLKHMPSNFLPGLADLEVRFKLMDKYPDMVEVLTVANPPVETMLQVADAVDVSRQVNDEMAELVTKYPNRFVGAVACLPMNDVDEALKETDRAVKELNFRGIQLFTNIMGKPLDSPEFMPIYERMAQLDLPIWIHPFFENIGQVAQTEKEFSGYRVFTGKEDPAWAMDRAVFGLPSASARALIRLVYSRVFDLYPNIKFMTHHCGAGVPFFANRIEMHYLMFGEKEAPELGLKKPVHEYFKLFYADTALHGNTPALMCGYDYFGPDRLFFGTDMPFGSELGLWPVRKTIDSIDQMSIPKEERRKIYAGNAQRLLRLPTK